MDANGDLGELVEGPEMKLMRGIRARESDRERKRKGAIVHFLGEEEKMDVAVIEPRYYGELLAWALHRYIEIEGWRVVNILGYHTPEPVYIDVNTGCGEPQNVLRDDSLLVEKRDDLLPVTIDANLRGYNSVVVTRPAQSKEKVRTVTSEARHEARQQSRIRTASRRQGVPSSGFTN